MSQLCCDGVCIMKQTLTYILSFLFTLNGLAQVNLVPNGGFEEYTNCPQITNQLYFAKPWYNSSSSPDYFNECGGPDVNVPNNLGGYQSAYDGQGYAGLSTYDGLFDSREMISVKLIESLKPGQNYCVELYLNAGDKFTYGGNNMGVYFSNDSVNFYDYQYTVTPQINFEEIVSDTANWIKLQTLYTALGGERFISLGNFYNNSATEIVTINDTVQWPFTYYYIDDVSIIECNAYDVAKIPNVFTPNNDGINENFKIEYLPKNSKLAVYNRWGNEVYQSDNYQNNWDGEKHPDGVYYYVLTLPTGESKHGTITILRN